MSQINDIYGSIEIPQEAMWGANTQRSLVNFPIGIEKMPREFIKALLELKKAIAQVNLTNKLLDKNMAEAIIHTCDKLMASDFMEHFPLSIWQTGSGTQTNMNVNEVIANIANQDYNLSIHPNDHVNMGQSTNDVFPTAIHLCMVTLITRDLIPSIEAMISSLDKLEDQVQGQLKTGRTHLQDATPISFSQEVSGWCHMYQENLGQLKDSLPYLRKLAIGGTAVGTGLNTYQGFSQDVCQQLNKNLNESFEPSDNLFHALSSRDALVFLNGALNSLASNSMKFANDIRWLASGPRCGLGEINLPANEAGSSIMPGKVNPTQAEALTMVCLQVLANSQAVSMANSQGNFQLNVYMPMILYNSWQSLRLLSDALNSFRLRCLDGITINKDKMQENLEKSLMTATYLNKKLGYDATAKIVKQAHSQGKNIKDIILAEGLMTEAEFDTFFNYEEMIDSYSLNE